MAKENTRITTGEVRLSFVHLFEPYAGEDGDTPKYSATLIIPKSDTGTVEKIRNAQQAALRNGKETRFGGQIPKNWRNTLRDGDESDRPEYEGCYYMSVRANADRKPSVVDQNVNEILDKSEIYSGVYARAAIEAFPYNTNGKGVSFQILAVQKTRDGEPLAGGAPVKASDLFEPVETESEGESLI